ncbi:cytochrome c [soil metagenome]
MIARRKTRSPETAAAFGTLVRTLAVSAVVLLLSACRQDMYNQPKAKAYSETKIFENGTSAQPIPANTVQYHGVHESEAFYTGVRNGVLLAKLPMQLSPEVLARGRERYDIYCAVCHGATGEGDGEIVQRGFPAPPTYHSERLRNAPIGHFFDVITNGYGVMYPYASRVEPSDRWAIAAYIRALQLSRHSSASDLPPADQRELEGRK